MIDDICAKCFQKELALAISLGALILVSALPEWLLAFPGLLVAELVVRRVHTVNRRMEIT